jgi:regulator of sigma E protease
MEILIKITQLVLSLSILIVLHEMGHFFPARWFKTRVEKFYLFFDAPPFNSLWKVKSGETEYGIGWLPLGGYVKISGMVDESMDTAALKEPPKPWEFRSKPAWQRLIIMIGGVTVNFLLGIFIFAMSLWYWGKSYVPTEQMAANGIAFDSLLLRQGFRQGDLILKVGDKPFNRFEPGVLVQSLVLGDASTIVVRREGQEQVIQLPADIAQQITGARLPKGSLMAPRIPFFIDKVADGSGAKAAGVLSGDRLLSLNGLPIQFYDEFAPAANQYKGQSVNLKVLRGQDTLLLNPTLSAEGKLGVIVKTDGYFKEDRLRYGFFESFPAGYQAAKDFLNLQLQAFGQMFKGKIKAQDNLGSFLSIGNMFPGVWNWEAFWGLTASLSILLAFMNLLPIPALDGGYVLFLIIEVLTGRRMSDTFMERAVTFGFFLMIGLMIYALGLDIWRFFIR